jgi:AAA domain
MVAPHRFASRTGDSGSPLPDPFDSLAVYQVHFRRGSVSMIAGTPGSFKSILALNMLAYWSGLGIGCQYFSADSDEFTTIKRLGGILTGDSVDTVEKRILSGERRRYEAALRKLQSTQFEYKQMDIDGIVNHVRAYEAVYGIYPEVIFLDNLIDFADSPDDWGGMLVMIKELDQLAKDIKAHICILHHAKLRGGTSGKGPEPGRPPADWEIQGKVTQIPRLVLTLAADSTNLRVASVKNTNGQQFRDASVYVDFQVLNSMRVEDINFRMGRSLCPY